MPVLMNKGADPRQAAWLFYTDRATLDGLGALTVSERYDAGVLTVDAADLDAAKKASTGVPVYLAIATLVPKDFDLAQLSEATAQDQPEDADENPTEPEAPAQSTGLSDQEPAPEAADPAGDDADVLPYDPVPAPEGTRVPVGLTTAAAARAFIQPREVDGEPWAAELPGLQMLAQLIDHLRQHSGLPAYAIWHVDETGVLRMAPAKQVKPMAGNVLKCKL